MTEVPTGVVSKQSCAVDVWAAGVLAYTLLAGYAPFGAKASASRKKTPTEVLHTLCTEPADFKGHRWKGDDAISNTGRDVIESMLKINAALRPTAADLLKHPWLTIESPSVSDMTLSGLYRNARVF